MLSCRLTTKIPKICFFLPSNTAEGAVFFLTNPFIKLLSLRNSRINLNPQRFPIVTVSIHSRQQPSSSCLHLGRTALSVCAPASREGPSIWLHSGPSTHTPLSSALALCNVVGHTFAGTHWSFGCTCQPSSPPLAPRRAAVPSLDPCLRLSAAQTPTRVTHSPRRKLYPLGQTEHRPLFLL